MRRAEVEEIDGTAAVVQHCGMVPRRRSVLQHNVTFSQTTCNKVALAADAKRYCFK